MNTQLTNSRKFNTVNNPCKPFGFGLNKHCHFVLNLFGYKNNGYLGTQIKSLFKDSLFRGKHKDRYSPITLHNLNC